VSLPKYKDLPGSHYPDIYDGKFPLKTLQNFILHCCPDPPVISLLHEEINLTVCIIVECALDSEKQEVQKACGVSSQTPFTCSLSTLLPFISIQDLNIYVAVYQFECMNFW
jgi:hypothetical protein